MSNETNEVTAGCITGLGCIIGTIIANVVFWGALLWVVITILRMEHVIK